MARREDLVHIVVAVVTVGGKPGLSASTSTSVAKSESRRRWALERAIDYARSHPGADVTAKANEFLVWLDAGSTEPPAHSHGGSGITFA